MTNDRFMVCAFLIHAEVPSYLHEHSALSCASSRRVGGKYRATNMIPDRFYPSTRAHARSPVVLRLPIQERVTPPRPCIQTD